ncbi:MAG: hypothetical protein AB7Q97_01645 [Gammaproteobacteria bacterium]
MIAVWMIGWFGLYVALALATERWGIWALLAAICAAWGVIFLLGA